MQVWGKTYAVGYDNVWIPKFMRLGGKVAVYGSHGRLTLRAQVL